MNPCPSNKTLILSLTSLWALVESGLGGMMHAMHLPFTGIFIGGFAVLIIAIIAQYSNNPMQDLLKCTLIVLIIKAVVSPYSPPTSYLAVGFQGVLGAFIFQNKTAYKWAVIPFAVLCMAESAAQKLLVLLLFFGKSFFEAIDIFIHSAAQSFGFTSAFSYSNYIVLIYCLIYLFWGVLLGIWILKIPKQIAHRKNWYNDITTNEANIKISNPKQNKWAVFGLIVAIIVLAISYNTDIQSGLAKGLHLIIRAALILCIWLIIILPLWQSKMRHWLSNQKFNNRADVLLVHQELDLIKKFAKPLYDRIRVKYKRIRLIKEFVLGLLVISIYRKYE